MKRHECKPILNPNQNKYFCGICGLRTEDPTPPEEELTEIDLEDNVGEDWWDDSLDTPDYPY